MDFSQLTIVVPSYNRQNFLKRQYFYWAETNVSMIFIDGSEKPIDEHFRQTLNNNSKFSYIHFVGPVGKRILKASKLINTSYSMTCNDDDFLFKSGVNEAIKLLDSELDVVACRGQSIRARVSKDGKKMAYTNIFNNFQDFNVDQDLIFERLIYAFEHYNSAGLFSVLRTSVWKESWVEGYNQNYSSTNISEFYQNIVVYIHGKLACLKIPYLLETDENGSISTDSDNRGLLFSQWARSELYEFERTQFVETLSKKIVAKVPVDSQGATELVDTLIEKYIYLRENFSVTFYLFESKSIAKILESIIPLLKLKYLLGIYFLVRRKFISYVEKSKSYSLDELLQKKLYYFSSESVTDIKNIENNIINFYRNENIMLNGKI
jgi:glycosyltransferase domain-containing protein